MSNHYLVVIVFLFGSFSSNAQSSRTYKVSGTYAKKPDSIKSVIKRLQKEELNALNSEQRKYISPILTQTTKRLNDQVEDGIIISNSEFQGFVEETYELLASSFQSAKPVKQILISNDPSVNAISYSQGTIVMNIGLLAIVENQSQLGFIVAHELAHYEMSHVFRKNTEVPGSAKSAMRELKKMAGGGGSNEGYNSILSWLDGYSSISQKLELEADSLAFAILSKTSLDVKQADAMLQIMSEPYNAKAGSDLAWLRLLEMPKFRLDPAWFEESPNIYKNYFAHDAAKAASTIKTHPEFNQRRQAFHRSYVDNNGKANVMADNVVKKSIADARFERIAGAKKHRMFDLSLYLSLIEYLENPNDLFLTKNIARMMYTVYNAKIEGKLNMYVPVFTPTYPDELKAVNNMLYNMTDTEVADLAYNFLLRKNIASLKDKELTAWAWKFADLTNRVNEKKSYAKIYKTNFKGAVATYKFPN